MKTPGEIVDCTSCLVDFEGSESSGEPDGFLFSLADLAPRLSLPRPLGFDGIFTAVVSHKMHFL